jgi:hypothetical protein
MKLPYHPAIHCRCPDVDCTGWRKVPSLGGGHVSREDAMALLRRANDERNGVDDHDADGRDNAC